MLCTYSVLVGIKKFWLWLWMNEWKSPEIRRKAEKTERWAGGCNSVTKNKNSGSERVGGRLPPIGDSLFLESRRQIRISNDFRFQIANTNWLSFGCGSWRRATRAPSQSGWEWLKRKIGQYCVQMKKGLSDCLNHWCKKRGFQNKNLRKAIFIFLLETLKAFN